MRHIISILIENEAGALSRVAGLFSARGYNIESLTVSETEHGRRLSRITVVVIATPKAIHSVGIVASGIVRVGAGPRVIAAIPVK